MKIHEAKNTILKAMCLLDSMKLDPANVSLFQDVQMLLGKFTPDTMCSLKKDISIRRKKRERITRRREELKAFKIKLHGKRLQKSSEADAWLRQCQEAEERIKTEESVRLQADTVLHFVTRKKMEARRILALLPAISRLRSGRCQQDAAQGGRLDTENSAAFETALEKLHEMWGRQLKSYNTEESMLKVMLEEGSASRLGRLEREVEGNLHDWLRAIFGESSFLEKPWQELVETRRAWDQFIVPADTPLSSGIPTGWLLPPPLERQDWKDAVLHN